MKAIDEAISLHRVEVFKQDEKTRDILKFI